MTTIVTIDMGGTGATHAAGAREALSVPSMTDMGQSYAQANSARDQANTARTQANTAYDQANTARTQANTAYGQANSAFTAANNRVLRAGDTMTGSLNFTFPGANLSIQEQGGLAAIEMGGANGAFIDMKAPNSDDYDFRIMTIQGSTSFVSNNAAQVVAFSGANVNFDSGTLFVDSVANEVGIGTTNPTSNLHIVGNANITTGINTTTVNATTVNAQTFVTSTGDNVYATAINAYGAANTRLSASGGTLSGDLIITGNLTVSGNQTILNTEVLTTEDADIILLSNTSSTPALNAGLIINRGTSTNTFLRWNEALDEWGWSDSGTTTYYFEDLRQGLSTTNTTFATINTTFATLNTSAGTQNTATTTANDQANTARGQANTARDTANSAYGQANAAYSQANSAYGAANNRVLKAGDTMTGQLNISSGGLLVTGNVGIGTTSPTSKLQVVGVSLFQALAANFNIVESASGGAGGLQFFRSGFNNWYVGSANSSTGFAIGEDSTLASPALFFASGGKLGIGTTNPLNARLQISGANTGPDLSTTSVANATAVLSNSDSDYGMYFASYGSGKGAIQQRRGASAVYYDLSLQPHGGNLGIGTTNPGQKLDLTARARFRSDGTSSAGLWLTDSSGTEDVFMGLQGTSATANWGVFSASAWRITLTNAGNVGIGVTTPQRRLDVTGSGILASFGSQMSVNSIAGIHFGYSETPSNSDLYKKSAMVFERTDNHNQGGNASGKIHFLLHNTGSTSASGTNSAVLTLDTDGNGTLGSARVGIANTAPNHGLSVNGTAFIGGNTTIIGGTTTVFDVRAADAGYAMVRVGTSTNGSQTTGAVELTQDGAYGGGMFYNGDGSPSFATGEASGGDVITFYRMNAGTRVAVFEYPYSANTVTFRGDVYATNSYYLGTTDNGCVLQRIGSNLILNQGSDSSSVMAVGGAGALQLIMDTNNNETTQKVSFQKNASYNGTEVGYINEDGNMYINGTLTESSSIALKENINPITNALELISQICGVTYDRKDGSAKNRAGLIAEHVEKVLPDIVQRDCYGSPAGIQYTNLIAYLVESIKELKAEIDVLKRQ